MGSDAGPDVAGLRDLAQRDLPAALQASDVALQRWPLDPQLWLASAEFAQASGLLDSAISRAERSATLGPDDDRVWALLAELHRAAVRPDEALAMARAAVARAPHHGPHHLRVAILLASDPRTHEAALAVARRAAALAPDDPVVLAESRRLQLVLAPTPSSGRGRRDHHLDHHLDHQLDPEPAIVRGGGPEAHPTSNC
jgi:tetratricopeptide (TPR) repeat protein